jgi:hypothetical protein
MALTNIDKKHLKQLIEIPNLELLEQDKIIKAVQRNSNNYSKLKILFKQMQNIKNEIEEVIKESVETENLEKIKCNFKKIPGKNYFLYQKPNNELFFSMLSPKEWNSKNLFICEFFYDYDHTLQKL